LDIQDYMLGLDEEDENLCAYNLCHGYGSGPMGGSRSAWDGWTTYTTEYSDIRNHFRELMRIREDVLIREIWMIY